MTLTWVLGRRGLLGSAFCRALQRERAAVFVPAGEFCWANEAQLASQIEVAVDAFALRARQASRWEIYWAAGIGTMGSTEESLAPEVQALRSLIQRIQSNSVLLAMPGALVLSSSAGAIYASSRDEVITEDSAPAPNSAYARAKLRQEELLRAFGAAHPQVSVLLARISTLYGTGQAVGKAQGLLTHMARSIVRNRPIGIYVPIDTIRDYISVDDAASEIIGTLREPDLWPGVVLKIVASGRPTTIAEIISIFKRISRKPSKITTGISKISNLYQRKIQFQSVVGNGGQRPPMRSLGVGIHQILNAERAAYANPEKNEC